MRRTFGMIALLGALAGAGACLAQDQQTLQAQQDQQQRNVEQGLDQQQSVYPGQQQYRSMAAEARRRAELAQSSAQKTRWLKMAANWDKLAR
jgi:hypothetical protein